MFCCMKTPKRPKLKIRRSEKQQNQDGTFKMHYDPRLKKNSTTFAPKSLTATEYEKENTIQSGDITVQFVHTNLSKESNYSDVPVEKVCVIKEFHTSFSPCVISKDNVDHSPRSNISSQDSSPSSPKSSPKVAAIKPGISLPSVFFEDSSETRAFQPAEKFRYYGSRTGLHGAKSLTSLNEEPENLMKQDSRSSLHNQLLNRRFQRLKVRTESLRQKDAEIRNRYQELLKKRQELSNIRTPLKRERARSETDLIDCEEETDRPVPPPRRRRSQSFMA